MYFHRNCGGPVFVVKQVIVTCGLNITAGGLQIAGSGKLNKQRNSRTTFICGVCNKELSSFTDEVVCRCSECGENFSADNLYVLNAVGGIYCGECAENQYSGTRRTKVSTIISKAM